jgi:hypothetical protein
MSSSATNPASKRVRFSKSGTNPPAPVSTDPAIGPGLAGELLITQKIASRSVHIRTFFIPLLKEFLALRYRRIKKLSSVKSFEDPDFIPRSFRLAANIGFTTDAREHQDSKKIYDAMSAATAAYQAVAREQTHAAAKLEVEVLQDKITQQFVQLLIHLCSTTLIELAIPYTDNELYELIQLVSRDSSLLVDLCTFEDVIRILQQRFPRVSTSNPVFLRDSDVNHPHSKVVTVQSYVRSYILDPWSCYTNSLKSAATLKSLQKYSIEQATTKATETAAMEVETNPTLRNDTIQSLIDAALAKQSKVFDRKQKSLENSIKQMSAARSTKNEKSGGSNTALAKTKSKAPSTPKSVVKQTPQPHGKKAKEPGTQGVSSNGAKPKQQGKPQRQSNNSTQKKKQNTKQK